MTVPVGLFPAIIQGGFMGRTVSYKEYRQRPNDDMAVLEARRETIVQSEPEVLLDERSLITEPVMASEAYCSCCEDCYHKRSNWNKFLDWLRRVLWVM